jgi:putative MATE family efflux protein
LSPSFQQKSLRQVAGPLWVENMLRTSLTTVDVFMLSFYSEKAVAAVGLVNQFVFFMQLMYLMVSSGASILMAQYLGAGERDNAQKTALGSVVLGVAFALVLSLVVALAAPGLIGLYGVEPVVHQYAVQFLVIYASGSVFVALSMLQATLLRVHGKTKAPMFINMAANVTNVIGNSLFLFGWFGLPVLGVAGVALSTVLSQALTCVALAVIVRRSPETRLDFRRIKELDWSTYKRVLAVGVPTGGENLSYNLAQIVNMRFISSFGTLAMTAYVYLGSFLRYVFISSISIGSATQIKVGWWVGQGKEDTAARKALRYFLLGMAISTVMVVLLYLFHAPVFGLMTKDSEILALIGSVLIVSMVLEPGRNFNVILIPALKGAGDVKFPVILGVIFMWGVGVLGSWLFGVVFGWGLIGVYVALCTDEWTRGLMAMFRWKSGKWRGKGFVANQTAAVQLKAVSPVAEEE